MSSVDPGTLARRAIALLDLTELGDTATDLDVDTLCARAVGPVGTVAAVCVWPRHVGHARQLLADTGVRIATVVNFPSGDEPLQQVVDLTRTAIADGADEIDVVIPYRSLLAGEHERVVDLLQAVRLASADHTLKVILETGELAHAEHIRTAAELAVENGADFIKTSTGKTPVSATLAATEIMLDVIRHAARPVGLKPSGGIRTFDDAVQYLEQADRLMGAGWATPTTFRFGASGLLTALVAVVAGTSVANSQEAY